MTEWHDNPTPITGGTVSVVNVTVAPVPSHVCGEVGCTETRTLYNIDFNPQWLAAKEGSPTPPPRWRCAAHFPPHVLFPVSMYGDDWIASGRDPKLARTRGVSGG